MLSIPIVTTASGRCVAQVKTEIIPGCGHDLTIVNPDLVTGKVLQFLGEQEGVAAAAV